MLHYMHYHVGKSLQQKKEKQRAAKKNAKDQGKVHRQYSRVWIEHQRTDIWLPNISGSVVDVGKDMVTKKKQGRGNDVYQICRIKSVVISVAQHTGL